jgi:hypothetical protein
MSPGKLGEASDYFDDRFNAYLRIEPRCRQDDFARGIQVRTADPLWMLARQWQTGEFLGEDAGSLIKAEMHYSTQPIDRIRLGEEPSQSTLLGVPLETVVEQELGEVNYRERVRIGQEFERRLRAKLEAEGMGNKIAQIIDVLRGVAGFPTDGTTTPEETLDQATRRFVRFMRNRVIDGKGILDDSIAVPNGSSIDQTTVDQVRAQVLAWYARVCNRPSSKQPPAWQPEKLDYQFESTCFVDASEEPQLIASDYRNGTIDWFTFTAGAKSAQGTWQAPTDAGLNPVVTTPTRIQISGTLPRWWAFEDGSTDFGDIDVAKPDLAKLLLMEFVLIYSDDWFSVPAPVSIGSMVKVDQLKVRNVFGEEILVNPARKIGGRPTERFDLFTITPAGAPDKPGIAVAGAPPRPILVIPPVTGFRQESPPLDQVHFLRDEMANMVWGVEHLVPNGLGRPVSGFDAQMECLERERDELRRQLAALKRQFEYGEPSDEERVALEAGIQNLQNLIADLTPYARPTPSQGEAPRYRLATTVPENWIPFIPVQRGSFLGATKGAIQFRRAKMLRNTDHKRMAEEEETLSEFLANDDSISAMSRLLALDEQALLFLNEESVPRAGLRVQLTKQRARWVDGSTHVWLGRKVLIGRGEGSSGLIWDTVWSESGGSEG